ncbi:heme o synthase [Zooshikella harenae]|uniref:Protoheme IX farnesyltransferase n=1 Tax=Zooshikella harenae TaxID=2827238 RepID=A0ABS5ZHL7_9GAMM|nr:heme o synthase [Zooshikella harenae]MBU2713474.1 heme o synthase [Zooshikella harenae]
MNNTLPIKQAAKWQDYLELCKPKVVALLMMTALIGMLLASESLPVWHILLFGNLGIAFCAASAAVINHLVDKKIDLVMARTQNRPIAQGRVEYQQAIIFASFLGLLGMCILVWLVNALTAWLTLASLIGYAVIYTLLLKRATPQNIVIGGLAGAAPPLLGWCAVTGEIHANALLLVLIIFAWTPPHFWALALHRRAEYASANVPMLPVTHGENYTKLHILLYTLLLIIITIFPFLTGMAGILYLTSAILLGGRFIYWCYELFNEKNKKAAINTFKFSITYLMLLFSALLIDHYTG